MIPAKAPTVVQAGLRFSMAIACVEVLSDVDWIEISWLPGSYASGFVAPYSQARVRAQVSRSMRGRRE